MDNVGGSNNYGHVSDRALKYFKDRGCKTMLDIGCGVGMNVAYANEVLDFEGYGIEGDKNCLSKKMIDDHTGQRIRKEMNIIKRDLDVWERTRDRYLTADVEALQKFIKDYKG